MISGTIKRRLTDLQTDRYKHIETYWQTDNQTYTSDIHDLISAFQEFLQLNNFKAWNPLFHNFLKYVFWCVKQILFIDWGEKLVHFLEFTHGYICNTPGTKIEIYVNCGIIHNLPRFINVYFILQSFIVFIWIITN